jgi:hypothetical protein
MTYGVTFGVLDSTEQPQNIMLSSLLLVAGILKLTGVFI